MQLPGRGLSLVVMVPLVARTAVLLAVAAGLGVAVDALRPGGLRSKELQLASTCSARPGAPAAEAPAITEVEPAHAQHLCGDPGVMVADVRASERFVAGHIADAVHLPCAGNAAASSGPLSRLARAHTVVVYGDSTEEARPVAEALRARLGGTGGAVAGPGRIVVLSGGFSAWDRAGLACSSGPCPDCKKDQMTAGEREASSR